MNKIKVIQYYYSEAILHLIEFKAVLFLRYNERFITTC